MSETKPPTARYKYTLTLTGNTLDEIGEELNAMVRGGFLLDSDYGSRDEWHVIGGRKQSTMQHVNPDMTPERYEAELDAWWRARRAER